MATKELLKNAGLFKGLTEEQIRLLLPCCQRRKVEDGEIVFREGDPAKFLYIIAKGRAALKMNLERPDGSTTGPTTVASVGAGDAFGWSAIVNPHIFTLSATAVEKGDLIAIDGTALRDVLNRHRDMGYLVMVNVAKLIAGRLTDTREALVYDRSWVRFQQRLKK